MAYSDFSLLDLRQQFGTTDVVKPLFEFIQPVEPSDFLREQIARVRKLPLRNEKAKSEAIISPVLIEVVERNDFLRCIRAKTCRRVVIWA